MSLIFFIVGRKFCCLSSQMLLKGQNSILERSLMIIQSRTTMFSAKIINESSFILATILEKQNVLIFLDVQNNEDSFLRKMVSEILDSISLVKYRIGLYSANGLSQKLLKFQSRQCSLNILK